MPGHDEQGLADPPPSNAAGAVRRGKHGEARMPPAVAVLIAIALYALLPDSLIVGSSGAKGNRFSEVTPSARTLPALTCGSMVEITSHTICICPPMTSVIAC